MGNMRIGRRRVEAGAIELASSDGLLHIIIPTTPFILDLIDRPL